MQETQKAKMIQSIEQFEEDHKDQVRQTEGPPLQKKKIKKKRRNEIELLGGL